MEITAILVNLQLETRWHKEEDVNATVEGDVGSTHLGRNDSGHSERRQLVTLQVSRIHLHHRWRTHERRLVEDYHDKRSLDKCNVCDMSLHLNLRIHLYKSSVYIIRTSGSEAWSIDGETVRSTEWVCVSMMNIITGKTSQQEVPIKWRIINLVEQDDSNSSFTYSGWDQRSTKLYLVKSQACASLCICE